MIRTTIIVLVVILITSVGVHAFDGGVPTRAFGSALQSISSAWSSIVQRAQVGRLVAGKGCEFGEVEIEIGERRYCVDRFEASSSSSCPHQDPSSVLETELNLSARGCEAQSVEGEMPWRHVSQTQAAVACQNADKELITPEMWYHVARDTPRDVCILEANAIHLTGARPACVSGYGVYDLVGNVWEWVDGVVEDGMYADRALPDAGHVVRADDAGIPTHTTSMRGELGAYERFWLERDGARGIMRGGFFKSGEDAGVYALHAGSPPSFSSAAVGFRCMRQL